jgi:hypothetical protein
MRRSLILALAVAAALPLGAAAPVRAGTYEVRACATAYGTYPNRSWAFSVPSDVWSTATSCAGDRPELTLLMRGDTATPALQTATMSFRPPAGAVIRDFTLNRQVYYYNPVRDAGTAPPYILYSWDGLQFAGAGEYDAATRDAINATGHWYGYPSGAADTGAQVVTKATFPRLNGTGDASSLTIDVGCWTTPCSLAANANVFTVLYGARVTVADDTLPSVRDVDGAGLFGAGSHGGDEVVSFGATDNLGIRRAELLDITDPRNARVVGSRPLPCDASRTRPCDDYRSATIAPSQRLPSGTRTLAVRVTDGAGNQATTAPRGTLVGGPLNGTNASATGRLRAVFSRGGKTRRTVKAGGQPAVSISLRDAASRPIGDARIQLRARQLRTGARFQSAGEVRTGADGRARLVLPRGTSREVRFEYRTRVDDPSPALRARVRLGVRPRATLRVRPRRVGFGGTIRLSGRVRSRPRPRPGKLVILQAFDRGRWRPLATARSGKGGRFGTRYRFTRTFRPRTYRFRARLPREAAYPYSTGNSRTVRVRVG